MPAPPAGVSGLLSTYLGTVTGTEDALQTIQSAVNQYNQSIIGTGMKVVRTPNRT